MTIVLRSTHLYTLKQSQLQRMTYVGYNDNWQNDKQQGLSHSGLH